ncbi:MAG: WD40 repeat domain-containing protein, partial [Chloroflexota bacterium]
MKTSLIVTVLLASAISVSCSRTGNQPFAETPESIAMESPTLVSTDEPRILDVAVSPDGTKLAVYANTGVHIYDMDSLNKTTLLEFESPDYEENSGAIAFGMNGDLFAVSGKFADMPIALWDLHKNEVILNLTDLPSAAVVTDIQFSPSNDSIFIRSFYGFTSRCEQADANFSLHTLDFSEPSTTRIFSQDICQTIPMGFVRFTNDNKFLLFVQVMGPQYSITTLNVADPSALQEITYNSLETLYDVSPNGKTYAFISSLEGSRATKLINAATAEVLEVIPYEVKLFDDSHRHFLVRDFFATTSEWGLWEDGNITCKFDGLTSDDFEFSADGKIFITTAPDRTVVIWNV